MNLSDIMITTGAEAEEKIKQQARNMAQRYQLKYIERNKNSVNKLIRETKGPVAVLTKKKLELFTAEDASPFFYHPNAAALRAKNWLMHRSDPLVAACAMQPGDTVIDGTLGLASDSLILSLAGGVKADITGVESSPVIAMLVKEGLRTFDMPLIEMKEAAARIHVINMRAEEFLRKQPANSADVVYLDPMFASPVESSHGIRSLRNLANRDTLSEELLDQALRVAGRRVVLKEKRSSPLFEKFGFHKIHRSSPAVPVFGYIASEEVRS